MSNSNFLELWWWLRHQMSITQIVCIKYKHFLWYWTTKFEKSVKKCKKLEFQKKLIVPRGVKKCEKSDRTCLSFLINRLFGILLQFKIDIVHIKSNRNKHFIKILWFYDFLTCSAFWAKSHKKLKICKSDKTRSFFQVEMSLIS